MPHTVCGLAEDIGQGCVTEDRAGNKDWATPRTAVAILGSGNIATDLLIKLRTLSKTLEVVVMAGIDPASDGLARARSMGVWTTSDGVAGLVQAPGFDAVRYVFDATSAKAHADHLATLAPLGKKLIDLTPAALGPSCVPVVNLDSVGEHPSLSMISCGGQATIPIVHAVARVAKVHYAEIVASIASKSAGPGTRANIDEFTKTTARAIEEVGGASRGKAIIILNPADPPLMMRDTVYTLSDFADEDAIARSVADMVDEVQAYVPGYKLKQQVQFERFGKNHPLRIPGYGEFAGLKSSVFLSVEGAGHYLPPYAGNLDIMTSAAMATAERLAARASVAA